MPRDTVVLTDTVMAVLPAETESSIVATKVYKLPRIRNPTAAAQTSACVDSITDTHQGTGAGGVPRQCDSIEAELPVVQKHYEDTLYEAWVSGPLDPQLDSIRVYSKRERIPVPVYKPPKRWHIGISVGWAMTPKGMQPYAGVGITYSLFSL